MRQVRATIPSAALPPPHGGWVWARRLLLAALLAVSLAYLPYRVYLRSGLSRYLTLQAELGLVRAENGRLRQENRRLLRELGRLGTDDSAVERVAREELGLVRAGEIVFKIEERP